MSNSMPKPSPDRSPSVADSPETRSAPSDASPPLLVRAANAADAFAFSSGLAAVVGGSLSLVASRVLGAPAAESWAILAASGTFIIYNLDRLRDIDRDRATSPLRTAFVVRNRQRLYAAVGIMAICFLASLLTAPASIMLLCMAIGLVGLFHRRLKGFAALKTAYVSIAWVAACVGIPWLASGRADAGPWLASILLASLAANLIASNLRDNEPDVEEEGARSDTTPTTTPALWLARAMTILAIAITLSAPDALHPLVWIPVCEGLTLAYFRPTERYGLIAVDGGLLVGAFVTSIHLGWAV